ncbi:MAG: RecX family transcriptional regulator [Chloroflexota bacterium]
MGIITAITPQQKAKNRVNVYVDGQFAAGLSNETAANLRVGQVVTAGQIAELVSGDTFVKARHKAMQLIGRRPRSQAEIRRSLRRQEFDEAVIDQVIAHLGESKLLDDEGFGRYWVEQRETFKPRSHLALRQELQQKGLNREEIEAALAGVDESEMAYRAAVHQASRLSHLPQDELRLKLATFLQRRGFHYTTIRETIERILEEMGNRTPD